MYGRAPERGLGLRSFFFFRETAMGSVVPTISSDGILTGIAQRADRLFAYYRVTQYSQSYIYYGQLFSFPYRIQQYKGNTLTLREEIKSDLEVLFGRHFEITQVDVDIQMQDDQEGGLFNIKIGIIVGENGIKYSLGNLIKIKDGKVQSVEGITYEP